MITAIHRSFTLGLAAAVVLLAGCRGSLPLDTPGRSAPQVSGGNIEFVYTAIDTLFARHVHEKSGLVDYEGIHADMLLQVVLDSIQSFDMSVLSTAADSLAFWINAYNITVIYYLRAEFNMERQDSAGFLLFRTPYPIAGELITLDDLEKYHSGRIIKFNEPRTHFALVCAALSCPPLLNRAYRGEILYRQLDERTGSFINDTTFNPLPGVSSLFFWYPTDFAGFVRYTPSSTSLTTLDEGTVREFIASYLVDLSPLESGAELEAVEYDWTVNEWSR